MVPCFFCLGAGSSKLYVLLSLMYFFPPITAQLCSGVGYIWVEKHNYLYDNKQREYTHFKGVASHNCRKTL